MREKFIAGNWKMHPTSADAARRAPAVANGIGTEARVSVALGPPFPYLALVGEMLKGSGVALGAQNLYPATEGAFTGEVSPAMLLDLGCKYVLPGHRPSRNLHNATRRETGMKTNVPLSNDSLRNETAPLAPLHLYLFRHGETAWSLSGQYTGRTDISLTPRGEDAARALGARIRDIPFARVLTSPLQRARQTCELARLTTPPEVEPDLTEWDHGDDEGRFPADVLKVQPGWNLFRDGAPNGETPGQIAERADRLLSRLRMMAGNIALFSHGHFARVLAVRWIGLTVEHAQHLLLDTASVSVLCCDRDLTDAPAIARWNSAAHHPFDSHLHPPIADTRSVKEPVLERRANEARKNPAMQKIRADSWGHPQPTLIAHRLGPVHRTNA